MKKLLIVLIFLPLSASALSVGWNRFSVGNIRPLYLLDQVWANYITATSTTNHSTFPLASTTQFSVGTDQWITYLATPAGAVLAVDNKGRVIATTTAQGTVTSVTGTYPVQSSGGTTPAISLAFGTTTANTWSLLQTFTSGFISNSSSTVTSGLFSMNGGASTTMLSVGNTFIQSAATSTFGAGISATALNLSGTATSTGANGFDLASGCFSVLGTCLQTFIQNATAYKSAANYATAAALPTNTYLNGTSGVGATLTAVALAGLTVDGQAVSAGQRILVKDEVDQTHNGIYLVTNPGSGIAAYVLTRTTDYNTSNDIYAGTTVPVLAGGTANGDTSWVQTTTGTITVGTSNIAFIESSRGTTGLTSITAGSGLLGGTITTSGTISLAWLWDIATTYSTTTNATTTPSWFKTGLFASSTSQLTYASTTLLTVSNVVSASTTISSGLEVGLALASPYIMATSTTATSSFAAAITVGAGQGTSTFNSISFTSFSFSATSTGSKGIQLTGGCFAMPSGSCLTSGGSSSIWPFTTTDTYSGTAVQSTTSPLWFKGTTPFSVIASSTFTTYASTTLLTVANVASASSTVSSGFEVGLAVASPYFMATSTIATSTFGAAITVGAGQGTSTFGGGISFTRFNFTSSSTASQGIQLTAGCFAMPNGACLVTSSGGTVTSVTQGTGMSFSGTPITTTGTISLAVPVIVSSGGTATTTGGVTNGVYYFDGSTHTNSYGLVFNGNNVGVGTTTPWGILSIASSTFNCSTGQCPVLIVATSSDVTGDLFSIFSTTSGMISVPSPTLSISPIDTGVRVVVGAFRQLQGLLLDQLNINGRINTGEWFENECDASSIIQSNADVQNICGGWTYQIDGTGVISLNANASSLLGSIAISQAAANANTGSGLFAGFAGTGGGMIPATSTPIMEFAISGSLPAATNLGTSTIYAGFVNIDTTGTAFETPPTSGCYLTASSTQANWQAVCLSSLGATQVSAPFTALTSYFVKYRIEMDANSARFFYSTPTTTMRMFASISGNSVATTTKLSAGIYSAVTQASLSSRQFNIEYIRLWYRRLLWSL